MTDPDIAEVLRALRTRARLSREELAKAVGLSRSTSFARYENSDYMRNRRLPVDLAAKLALALTGKGAPPIEPSEIWALAEAKSGLTILPAAVVSIPVVGRADLKAGREALRQLTPESVIMVAGLEGGNYFALRVEDQSSAQIAPPGSLLIVDAEETELRDGRRYLVMINGEPEVRRWYANPPRLESEAFPPGVALYPVAPVEIIGRILRVITEL